VGLALRHPDIGELIGDYTVVAFLGAGGLGIVYKVERGGLFFALKLLLVPALDGRAKREIGILSLLDNPCVVRYVGSDFWPDPANGHPYIVMEFVPGDTLRTFAYTQNPSARKATRLVLDTALTLGEVHAAGVFHRDVKPQNILIRGVSERPILIDFGIGSFASAPTVTGSQLPPGTEEFRSPEQIRFRRAHEDDDARYEFGPADELWALGVTYYWLLTDALPFPDELPRVEAPGVAAPAGGHEPPVPSAPVPPAPEREPAAAAPHPRRAAWHLGLVGAVLTVAVVALSVGSNLGGPGSTVRTSEARPEPPLPSTSPGPHATDAGVRGREVALAARPLESLRGGDAAPAGASLPASTANAMVRTSAQTPKNETPKTQTQGAGFRLPVKPAAVAVCALLDGGCTAPASQVRPTAAPVECPSDWQASHERLSIFYGGQSVVLQGYKGENTERATVREGPVSVVLSGDGMGELPRGALLSGTLQLGEGRFYGTFTQAQIPGGENHPVCLVIGHDKVAVMPGGPDCPEGLGDCPAHESRPGNVKIFTRFDVFPKGSSYGGGFF
jgi:serine/threonine protein kinase